MDADLQLLERWRAGDKRAGEQLFQRHFEHVLKFFSNKAWSHAEDLTQQTFLECVRARDQFRGLSSFRTYLFAIAWNQLRHHYRRATQLEQLDFDVSTAEQLAAEAPSLSSHVDQIRRGERIHAALARLPIAQQVLLEYHYWYELEASALAEIFEVPPGTIRVRLSRARNALRVHLGTTNQTSDAADDPLSASLNQLEADDDASRNTG